MLLKGKNVFLTGGSRGIGKSALIELAKNGANIGFTYLQNVDRANQTLEEISEINPDIKIKHYQMDVKDSKQVEKIAEEVINDFGSINIVVNNAGNLSDNLLINMTDKQWFDVINTHLTGTFYVCREFLNEFIYNKGGKFVNVSSISHTGSVGQANYSAAKAGIIGLSKTIAKEYGRKNIYCNVVVPGYFDTDLTRNNTNEKIIEYASSISTLKRAGKTEEFGKVVVFLSSDLSSFVNGEVINVTGGIKDLPPL